MIRARTACLLLIVCVSCVSAQTREAAPDPMSQETFKQYWFSGKAELTRYRLQQARYGEIREGDAVLVFVTEDFLPDRQVKPDSVDRSVTGAVPILKLNLTKKFDTGIYPYSIMTSVFTPLAIASRPRSLKTSTSVQEWCGHTWLQLNLRGDEYALTGHSYFESEADQEYALPATWLEDEIWTRIRLAPGALPTGSIEMIPGGEYTRLRHRDPASHEATATLRTGEGVSTYTVEYPKLGRSLSIRFDTDFPHEIQGWEETIEGRPTTRAERTHSLRTDYWTKNANADAPLRQELGLD